MSTRGYAALVLGLALTGRALAADPVGTWLTDGGKSRVRIANCGAALCGTIVWLKDPNNRDTGQPVTDRRNADPGKRGRPVIGIEIIAGMKPSGTPGRWAGDIYNPEDGKTYGASLQMIDARTVELKGCGLGGLICKTQTWSRAN